MMLGQLIGPSAFILIDENLPAIMWECPSSSSAHAADDLIELCDDTADDNVTRADAFIADAYAKVLRQSPSLDRHDRFSRSYR
jgi:hypothetical protein